MLLYLENEDLGYQGDVILRNISLSVSDGERVALVGKSGAGKSTLLSVLQSRFPDDIALIPQDTGLVRALSLFHNVYMGRLHQNSTLYNLLNLVWPQKSEVEKIQALTTTLGLEGKLFERTGELSGGQQQRTAVCRAIYQGGSAVLGDEPVSAVDNRQAIQILEALNERFDTIVLAMHDVDLAIRFSDRIVGIQNGKIALDQPAKDLQRQDLDFLYIE